MGWSPFKAAGRYAGATRTSIYHERSFVPGSDTLLTGVRLNALVRYGEDATGHWASYIHAERPFYMEHTQSAGSEKEAREQALKMRQEYSERLKSSVDRREA